MLQQPFAGYSSVSNQWRTKHICFLCAKLDLRAALIGIQGGEKDGDLVLEEIENPLGGGGCTIVIDEAIPLILFFACSITFNILVGARA